MKSKDAFVIPENVNDFDLSIIKQKLRQAGMTQAELAHYLEIDPATLSRIIKTGDAKISLLTRIAHFLEFDSVEYYKEFKDGADPDKVKELKDLENALKDCYEANDLLRMLIRFLGDQIDAMQDHINDLSNRLNIPPKQFGSKDKQGE